MICQDFNRKKEFLFLIFRSAVQLLPQVTTLNLSWKQFITDWQRCGVHVGAIGRAHRVSAAGKESMQHNSGERNLIRNGITG